MNLACIDGAMFCMYESWWFMMGGLAVLALEHHILPWLHRIWRARK